MRLQSTQPAVSAQLKRLRALTGDPLLVRAGNGMVPTETALQLLAPAARMLQDADRAVQPARAPARLRAADEHRDRSASPPATTSTRCSCPSSWRTLKKRRAAACASSCCRCRASSTTGAAWPAATVDLVIGNWLEPPDELHLGKLMTRRDRLPGRRGPSAVRSSAARRAARAASRTRGARWTSSATWPASMSRRRRCTPTRPA